jgi:hypothetical protein
VLAHFGLTLKKFGDVLTKTHTISLDFFLQCVTDNEGRQRLEEGLSPFSHFEEVWKRVDKDVHAQA